MKQILYIWAKENNDYKYQQGMNEILATLMCALASELLFKDLPNVEPENLTNYKPNGQGEDAYSVFKVIHDPVHLQDDLYNLFSRLMDLGIKDLFY